MAKIDPSKFCQVAIVVKDLEATAKNFSEILGVEMPEIFTTPPAEESHTQFQGKPTATRARLAVFNLGPVVLELIEPDDRPGSWTDFLEKHGEGVHHLGFAVDDLKGTLSELSGRGINERHSGDYPGGRYVFVDSKEKLGVFLNLKFEP